MGANKLWDLMNSEPFVPALGALSGNQAMQMVRAGLKAVYCSGWQVKIFSEASICVWIIIICLDQIFMHACFWSISKYQGILAVNDVHLLNKVSNPLILLLLSIQHLQNCKSLITGLNPVLP